MLLRTGGPQGLQGVEDGGCLTQTNPFLHTGLIYSLDAVDLFLSLFCLGVGWVTIAIKEFRKLNLITDGNRSISRVRNSGRKVTKGNVEVVSGGDIKSKVSTTPSIQPLEHQLFAHTLK